MTTTVSDRAKIPLPIDACWEKLRDLTRARHYVPGLRDAVVTTMTFSLPWGPLGAWLEKLVMRRVAQGNVRDAALALALHYATDAPVPPERLAELRRTR